LASSSSPAWLLALASALKTTKACTQRAEGKPHGFPFFVEALRALLKEISATPEFLKPRGAELLRCITTLPLSKARPLVRSVGPRIELHKIISVTRAVPTMTP
jgi:hypothetical protein